LIPAAPFAGLVTKVLSGGTDIPDHGDSQQLIM